ncbi:MAG: nucleotidyltransferase family protein [Bacillota bacterium]
MTTPDRLESYRAGWRKYRQQKEQFLADRRRQAMEKAWLAAGHLKRQYGCKTYLFGSLAREGGFMEHSGIDLAVSAPPGRVNFWQLYSEVMNILAPFEFDLVELERIDPEVRDYILREGVEL